MSVFVQTCGRHGAHLSFRWSHNPYSSPAVPHSSVPRFIPPWLDTFPHTPSLYSAVPSHSSHLIPPVDVFPLAPPPPGVALSDTDVFCWYSRVFSSNTSNLPLFAGFIQLFLRFFLRLLLEIRPERLRAPRGRRRRSFVM